MVSKTYKLVNRRENTCGDVSLCQFGPYSSQKSRRDQRVWIIFPFTNGFTNVFFEKKTHW